MIRYAMSDCMCAECSLKTECWKVLEDDYGYEEITDEETLRSIKENDCCCVDCLIDCDCSKCSCYDECCERE